MQRFYSNRKAALAAVYWAMITLAMPQLVAIVSGGQAVAFSGRCVLLENASVLCETETNNEQPNTPIQPQINSLTPEQDLFVVSLEKQILDYLGQDLPQQHLVCNPAVPTYAELNIQLPTQPTLRRLEIMIQI